MTTINNISTQGLSNVGLGEVSSGKSIQYLFAQLQLELSKSNKTAAMEEIESIRSSQNDSKVYTNTINSMRNLQNYDVEKYGELPSDLETIQKEIETATAALEDLKQYENGDQPYYNATSKTWATKDSSTDYWFDNEYIKDASGFDDLRVGGKKDHILSEIQSGIEAISTRLEALKGYEALLTAQSSSGSSIMADCNITLKSNQSSSDIKNWISNLESSQEELGSDIQQKMILVQDKIGQYNSYMQGASLAISKAADVLSTLARGQ